MSVEDALKTAKIQRRSAKATLTRLAKALIVLLNQKRTANEVRDHLVKVKQAFDNVVLKHEDYTKLIIEDDDFETEEKWLDDCQNDFLKLDNDAKCYIEKISLTNSEIHGVEESGQSSGMLGMQTSDSACNLSPPHTGADQPSVGNENDSMNDVSQANHMSSSTEMVVDSPSQTSPSNFDQNTSQNEPTPEVKNEIRTSSNIPCGFRMEKPKLPKFAGDVREYAIFRADFKHAIESRYAKRDAITLLRTCLMEKPLDLIKGIGSDYDTAWEYLDSIYGDPRFVADTVTQDIVRFKPLSEGEDSRFCDLVHLVRRCYNTLKEVGIPNDMDSSHMLSIIEQKMCSDDRKVWSRDLEREAKPATLLNLINWMTVEMKSRMRATAAVRSSIPNRRSVNVVYGETDNSGKIRHRCWFCNNSNHWPDQCEKFAANTVDERINAAKTHHVCFSCLKKAGRDHRQANCSRKKQCTKVEKGSQCTSTHHPLLHKPKSENIGVAALSDQNDSMLPVIAANICGPNGVHKSGNVLFDSGAQISLIRKETAENLGLIGKDITVNIVKVGGEEEEIRTKIYKVSVTGINDKKKYIIKAIGIPCISEEIKSVRSSPLAELFNLPKRELRRGRGLVDLLIGIDHAHMHTGPMKQVEHLVARKSPLGWVIFGNSTTRELDNVTTTVLHVKNINPVDLSDFWTTESMGVQVDPCVCDATKLSQRDREEKIMIENSARKVGNQWMIPYPWKRNIAELPDNKEQAMKRLESTERRLLKNPDEAAAYNHKIIEMEEMNFASKLTEKEIEDHKGPVHYIAHHAVHRPDSTSTPVRIVFNSSS